MPKTMSHRYLFFWLTIVPNRKAIPPSTMCGKQSASLVDRQQGLKSQTCVKIPPPKLLIPTQCVSFSLQDSLGKITATVCIFAGSLAVISSWAYKSLKEILKLCIVSCLFNDFNLLPSASNPSVTFFSQGLNTSMSLILCPVSSIWSTKTKSILRWCAFQSLYQD